MSLFDNSRGYTSTLFQPLKIVRYLWKSWWTKVPKFMQTLDDMIYRELEKVARKRGITIQELIRAVIVPEWINGHNHDSKEPGSSKLNH